MQIGGDLTATSVDRYHSPSGQTASDIFWLVSQLRRDDAQRRGLRGAVLISAGVGGGAA